MGLGETTIKWRVSFFMQFVGFFCTIAAVASTFMAAAEQIPNKFKHLGFWDKCDDTRTYGCQDMIEYLYSMNMNADWVYGCRAMAVLTLIVQFFTMVASLWMAYMASGIHIGNLVTAVGDFLSVIVGMIGGLVFVFNALDVLETDLEMDADPSWSFAVFILGQGLFFLAGIMQIYEACTAD